MLPKLCEGTSCIKSQCLSWDARKVSKYGLVWMCISFLFFLNHRFIHSKYCRWFLVDEFQDLNFQPSFLECIKWKVFCSTGSTKLQAAPVWCTCWRQEALKDRTSVRDSEQRIEDSCYLSNSQIASWNSWKWHTLFMSGIMCCFNLADAFLDLSVWHGVLSEYHLSFSLSCWKSTRCKFTCQKVAFVIDNGIWEVSMKGPIMSYHASSLSAWAMDDSTHHQFAKHWNNLTDWMLLQKLGEQWIQSSNVRYIMIHWSTQ